MTIELGALDLCIVEPGKRPSVSIKQTLKLAPILDKLGYSRFWIAEHHAASAGHVCPEIIGTVIAGLTDRIRIGSAGVLLRHYSPYKIAATFRLLASIYPGRIDLGVAKGLAPKDLDRDLPILPEAYPESIAHLVHSLLSASCPNPVDAPLPEVWVLGSGGQSSTLAAEHGLCYSVAFFLGNEKACIESIERYRAAFRESRFLKKPKWNISIAGICADSESDAFALLRGIENCVGVRPNVIGSVDQCTDRIKELCNRCQTHEVIFADLCRRFAPRVHSFKLLANSLFAQPAKPRKFK